MSSLFAFLFGHRNRLAAAPLVFALISTRFEWEDHWGIWSTALSLCAVGIALRAWAACHFGYGRGRKKTLSTTGPYAYVRNPLYLGNMTILAGATVASELVWLLPAVLAWAFLVYNGAMVQEERGLYEDYGDDFLRYRERVPAWLPRWKVIAERNGSFLAAALRQSPALILLLPFLLKELDMFGLGSSAAGMEVSIELDWGSPVWLAFGLLGQAAFFSRFLVQWVVSERAGESVVPMSFWYLSLVGSLVLLTYAIHRNEPVFMLAYLPNGLVYLRNIVLVHRKRRKPATPGP